MTGPGPGRMSRMRPAGGFTLVELLVVMVIIGILMAFILNAAMNGARRAEERATQALITKIETGLNDRLDALLQQLPEANQAHSYLGSVPNPLNTAYPIPSAQRAAVIAQYDYIRSEMPDTFLYDATNSDYPLNFAALPYTFGTALSLSYAQYILPLGNAVYAQDSNYPGSYGVYQSVNWGSTPPNYYSYAGTGIYGASYSARAALMKNLGCPPRGYDGVDNDGDGLVDDLSKEVGSAGVALIQANLAKHKPNTARAEVLYAILVEGQGPLGTIFRPDDFTTREVQDTDGDGLPEFVDAWGQPLQFYRWPIFYHSDLQRGLPITVTSQVSVQNPSGADTALFSPPYGTVYEQREIDTLDPNQMLVSPSWWKVAPGSVFFESYFHTLHEPIVAGGAPSNAAYYAQLWDRSMSPTTSYGAIYPRREFYSKFLIASAGPDGQLGLYQAFPPGTAQPSVTTANIQSLILEGYALQGYPSEIPSGGGSATSPNTINIQNNGADDITNQTLSMPGQGS